MVDRDRKPQQPIKLLYQNRIPRFYQICPTQFGDDYLITVNFQDNIKLNGRSLQIDLLSETIHFQGCESKILYSNKDAFRRIIQIGRCLRSLKDDKNNLNRQSIIYIINIEIKELLEIGAKDPIVQNYLSWDRAFVHLQNGQFKTQIVIMIKPGYHTIIYNNIMLGDFIKGYKAYNIGVSTHMVGAFQDTISCRIAVYKTGILIDERVVPGSPILRKHGHKCSVFIESKLYKSKQCQKLLLIKGDLSIDLISSAFLKNQFDNFRLSFLEFLRIIAPELYTDFCSNIGGYYRFGMCNISEYFYYGLVKFR